MKYLLDCILSVIFPSVCMGTIWQMPLIVHFLVPEGRYRYPEILFLWIKKPQYIQSFPIVLLRSNSWIILFFLGCSPFFSRSSLDVEAKHASQVSRKGSPLISELGPFDLHSTHASDSFHLLSIVVSAGVYSFCLFAGHRPSCICGFPLFWLQSNILTAY